MRFKSRSRALVGAAAAGLLALAGLTTVAPTAGAAPASTDRVAGLDRYGTAADAATRAYDTADTVVIASGTPGHLVDSLSANPIAGANDAPILLTDVDSIPAQTEAALATLDPTNIIIVGGSAAVSDAVETELDATYDVQRVEGNDRFATAAATATELGVAPDIDPDGTGGDPAAATVALADGFGGGLADAVAASPMLHQEEIPLLLTNTDSVPQVTTDTMDALGVEQVLVLGGTAAISQSVRDALEADGINVVVLAGQTRFETSTAIADFEVDFLGFDPATTFIANGFSIPDALAGGPLASVTNGPIVTVTETDVPAGTATWITDNAAAIDEIVALGGTAVINDATLAEAAELADEGTNQSFTVTPAEAALNTTSNETNVDTTDDNRGARQYTVTGLDNAAAYDIALFPAEYVTDTDGTITFRDTEGTVDTADDNNVADWTATTGVEIEVVNGTATLDNNGHVVDISPVNGTIAYTVDSTVADSVIPVIIAADTGSSDGTPDLDLNAANEPTDAFGIGGTKSWIPPEVSTGTKTAVTVVSTSTAGDFFIGDGDVAAEDGTYQYDSNDNFQAGGAPITMAQFEALLTGEALGTGLGDVLDVAYTQNADLASTFNVTDDNVPPPTNLKATVSDLDGDGTVDDATLTWTASAQADAVYNVYTGDCGDGFEALDTLVKQVNGTSTTINNGSGTAYCVGAVGATSGQVSTSDPSVTPQPPAANVAPLAIDNVITNNAGLANTFDTGDVFKIVFNEAMEAPAAGDIIRAADDDSGGGTYGDTGDTVADFVNGTNATFTLNAAAETVNGQSRPAGTVLTVTLTASPTIVTAGTTAGLQNPAMVTDQAGIADSAGKAWDLTAANQDKLINQDSADADSNSASVGPYITAADITTEGTNADSWDEVGDVLTVTFNEAVVETDADDSLTLADINAVLGTSLTNTGAPTASISVSGTTVTLTITAAGTWTATLDDGTVVDGSATGIITDGDGNNERANPVANPTVAAD